MDKFLMHHTSLSYLLDAVFHFYNVIKNMGKRKKEDDTFLKKKKQNQNIVTIITIVDGKGTGFPVKLKLERELFKFRY